MQKSGSFGFEPNRQKIQAMSYVSVVAIIHRRGVEVQLVNEEGNVYQETDSIWE